ncbi:MAG: ribosome biogenesis GTP-binding protein YihA/YsxC [Candidatus Paceibacterota bacterium]
MEINKAFFLKGVKGTDETLYDGVSQIAFIGRSNSGKSTTINYLTGLKNLAITSSTPGRTQQINVFLINDSFYFIDLPGYGYARVPPKIKKKIHSLVNWYFFESEINQHKVILIIDANVGMTKDDIEMFYTLRDHQKEIIILANKVDKIKKSEYAEKIKRIEETASPFKVIPFSAKKKIGKEELLINLYV